MTTYTAQAYNLLLQNLLFSITPALPSGGGGVYISRGTVGTPEDIPNRCFIVDNVSLSDGFMEYVDDSGDTINEADIFNGFINDANEYHENFGLTSTRIKSFWKILEYYKDKNTEIERIRLVTHGWDGFMKFPMFPGGNFKIGITEDQLDAFRDSDEDGLRWTLKESTTDSPLIHDITTDIIDGFRKLNSSILAPLQLNTPGSPITGDVKLFLDIVTDNYHLEYGTLMNSDNTTFLSTSQKRQLRDGLDYLESEIRKRLEGKTLGTPPNNTIVTATSLNNIKKKILEKDPGKLELIGPKESLPADIFAPASTPGSLEEAMSATNKDENDLRMAISGDTNTLMFSNRTKEILTALIKFHSSNLNLGGGNIITDWDSIEAISRLNDFFLICNDLYMLKNGKFEVTGGTDITTSQRSAIRDGLMSIANLIKSDVTSGASGITDSKLNTLRNTIESLSWQESLGTNTIKRIDERNISEFSVAAKGLNLNFRTYLNHFRDLIKSTSSVDIRGCRIGNVSSYIGSLRNFLGEGSNKPTISAPEWWQSFPVDFRPEHGPEPLDVYPIIDRYVRDGFTIQKNNPNDNIQITPLDVSESFSLWEEQLNFKTHFRFIKSLFNHTDADRLNFVTLEWCNWQSGNTGPGIPILNMQAQRIDDIITLNITNILERFRIIFEIGSGDGLSDSQRNTITGIQPLVVTYKALKSTIDSNSSPNASELSQFFSQLDDLKSDIDTVRDINSVTVNRPSTESESTLTRYLGEVQAYIISNIDNLLNNFFNAIQRRLQESNVEIRYYFNIGLVLPVQSIGNPTMTCLVVIISFETESVILSQIMECIRGWMKVQWTGSGSVSRKMNAHIDNLPVTSAIINHCARRSILSNGNPFGDPPGLPSHYCPTDDYAFRISTEP